MLAAPSGGEHFHNPEAVSFIRPILQNLIITIQEKNKTALVGLNLAGDFFVQKLILVKSKNRKKT